MPHQYLAIDLGAESGRLMLGTLERGRLVVEEVHRFQNTPLRSRQGLTWNFPGIMECILEGLRRCGARRTPLDSLSVTAWGVDYALFDGAGRILSPVFHYRDARTGRGVKAMHQVASREEIFAETGIQYMPLNTIYQLAAESSRRRERAHRVLMIADAVAFLLSGRARTEESAASTTAIYNPRTRRWSRKLTRLSGWSGRKLGTVVPSGRRLGPLLPAISKAAGLNAEVIASCSHDTACAVAAVPADGGCWAYLSSGTWSLMGVELKRPVFSEACQKYNFTNEVGFGGSIRLLKNIIGLWLVQECRRSLARRGRHLDYGALTALAASSKPFVSIIHPADPQFVAPDDMMESIAGFCRKTRQPVPSTPGEFIRCVLESLALIYLKTLRQLEEVTGRKLERLHIVGGGSRNALLNQFTASALGIPVIAGPEEATAIGNMLVQAIAPGHVRSLRAARKIVANSFETRTFLPEQGNAWEEPFLRMEQWG